MKLEAKIKELTFLGTPVTRIGLVEAGTQTLCIGHHWKFQCSHRVLLPILEFNLQQWALEFHLLMKEFTQEGEASQNLLHEYTLLERVVIRQTKCQ